MDILERLRDADKRGVAPPQNWTTEAADEIERLREALRPFAALAEHYPTERRYGNRPTTGVLFEISSANKTASYTVEDLHTAAALTPNGEVRDASRPAGEASSREAATSTVVLGTQEN